MMVVDHLGEADLLSLGLWVTNQRTGVTLLWMVSDPPLKAGCPFMGRWLTILWMVGGYSLNGG